jgi:hypothetical protein
MSASPPAPPKLPRTWIAYRIRDTKATWLGQVQAVDRQAAVAAAAVEFGVPTVSITVQQVGNDV